MPCMNFAEALSQTASEHGDRNAVKLDDVVLTYSVLEAGVARAAGLLRSKGVSEGDRVAIQLPNVPYFPVLYFGALRVGAVLVPMNPLLKSREVAFHMSDSGAQVLFAWPDFAEAAEGGAKEAGAECILTKPGEFEGLLGEAEPVEENADRADDDPAVIIYTSGTTGTPKGATLKHANLTAGATTGRELVDLDVEDIAVATLPLFHVFGMNSVMNAALANGGSITLVPRFEPGKVLEVIERDRATVFAGVPTMFSALLNHPGRESTDTSSLKFCISGGAAIPVEVLHAFEEAFGTTILEGYGLSETTGMASFNLPGKRKAGSIGVPVGGTEMKIVDDDGNELPPGEPGELIIRGPFVMREYWDRPDATEDTMGGGWLHTGDIAKVDEDGYFFIVDRKKELIIRGGYNVYPREIEEVIYSHPAVREAAVVGVPHDDLGEEVGAAVAVREGEQLTPDDLRAYVKERVAAYKYPRVVWLVDELPKGPTGKILKREIEAPDGDGDSG
jgi:long-chain acyl-CoA synthetase